MEFSTICRVCMQPISLEYIDLDKPFNDATYFECFNYCTKLEAKASDDFPKSICITCANLLELSYDFINAATEADRLFHECFAKMDNNKYDTDSDDNAELIIADDIESNVQCREKTEENEENSYEIKSNNLVDEDVILNNASSLDNLVEQATSETFIQNEQTQGSHENLQINSYILPDVEEHIYENVEIFEEEHDEKEDEITEEAIYQTEVALFETVESSKVESSDEVEDQIVTTTPAEVAKTNPTGNEGLNNIDLTLNKSENATNKYHFKFSTKPKNISKQKEDTKQKVQYKLCRVRIRKNFGRSDAKEYKCEQCDVSFLTPKQYKYHKAQNHKNTRNYWFCIKCGQSFETKAMLKTHIDNDHRNNNPGLCLTCGDSFRDELDLKQHVKQTHWSRKYPIECPHCRNKYQLETLPMHVKYAHLKVVRAAKNKKYCCKYCFNHYEVATDLEEHITTHKGKYVYSCTICGEDFKGKTVFAKHKKSKHKISNAKLVIKKCDKCDFTTTDECLLVKHKRKHPKYFNKRVPKFVCSYCSKKFHTLKSLNNHENNKHKGKKATPQCDLCGKRFVSNFKLQIHKKSSHGNDRPFMCKECPKAFKLIQQLRQHERHHFGKKIECPHCDKKFVQPYHLKEHLRTHTNELPFECRLCDKKFAYKVSLNYHLEKHLGIKRKCEYCPEVFDTTAQLRIHRFKHIGYPYVCELCKDNHIKKSSLIRHMRIYHKTIMTVADAEENRLRNLRNFYGNTNK